MDRISDRLYTHLLCDDKRLRDCVRISVLSDVLCGNFSGGNRTSVKLIFLIVTPNLSSQKLTFTPPDSLRHQMHSSPSVTPAVDAVMCLRKSESAQLLRLLCSKSMKTSGFSTVIVVIILPIWGIFCSSDITALVINF